MNKDALSDEVKHVLLKHVGATPSRGIKIFSSKLRKFLAWLDTYNYHGEG